MLEINACHPKKNTQLCNGWIGKVHSRRLKVTSIQYIETMKKWTDNLLKNNALNNIYQWCVRFGAHIWESPQPLLVMPHIPTLHNIIHHISLKDFKTMSYTRRFKLRKPFSNSIPQPNPPISKPTDWIVYVHNKASTIKLTGSPSLSLINHQQLRKKTSTSTKFPEAGIKNKTET